MSGIFTTLIGIFVSKKLKICNYKYLSVKKGRAQQAGKK
jgi:hypothetical protein